MFVHIPKSGYVGIGTVKREAQPYDEAEFLIDGELRKMTDLKLMADYRHDAPRRRAGPS